MSANTRTYPYKAWVVTPAGKPVELEMTGPSYASYSLYAHWDDSTTGKGYDSTKLSPTKEAAIEVEWNRLNEQEAKITKQLVKIAKKRAVLAKARAEA
ncbi:hypothetical protein NG831_06325 [Xanthomonas sacchari]|uniref:hypothetical protein n=1 Tax=Xanthomonas sacchari TaxID=56458 RepID=UPI002256F1A8|nr:hypothetical protein [Xanthomonas sacchari]MCW0413520.1 hypothetical protein [Xanthomonas sacchari]UYK67775.1 hypothetical protein NG831_06325 [Xanthomonas sacchari]